MILLLTLVATRRWHFACHCALWPSAAAPTAPRHTPGPRPLTSLPNALIIVAFNCNSAAGLKDFLQRTSADVFVAQELHTTGQHVDDLGTRAARNRWWPHILAALTGTRHGATGGVGIIVREGAVLAMGVYLSGSTKIVDRATGEVFRGEVPAYSVVVPGSLPDPNGGPSLYCAVIVKRVDAQTRAKTGVNELLRD
jgi:hypothetical protein